MTPDPVGEAVCFCGLTTFEGCPEVRAIRAEVGRLTRLVDGLRYESAAYLEEMELRQAEVDRLRAEIERAREPGGDLQQQLVERFGSFVCPSCGGTWFGTSDALDPAKRLVHCRDEKGIYCKWTGRGEDAGLKYPNG